MSLKRPGFKPSLKANMGSTKFDETFVKIPIDASMLFRFLNPSIEDPKNPGEGTIWYQVAKHYKLKTEEGKGLSAADLSIMGTEKTGTEDYINELVHVLSKHGDNAEKLIAKGLKTSFQWNAQVAVAIKQEDGTLEYQYPKILGLPRSGANSVNSVHEATDMAGEPSPFDIDSGFNIMIKHTKDSPWYAAQRAGSPISLDEILPAGWEKKFIDDIARVVNVTVLEYEEQKKAVQRTYANELDWELLQSEFGL